jgi:hypothetical protein
MVRLEGLGQLKNAVSSLEMEPDFPACSTVPQLTTLPHATPHPPLNYVNVSGKREVALFFTS